jgi:hypothetical protein
MTNNTKIISLDDRRRKAAPPLPAHWLERFSNPEPMNDQEREKFARDAGPHVKAWTAAIQEAGERQKQEALMLEWETNILEHLGYYDETGTPRPELKEKFFVGHQLKLELWQRYPELKPAS